MLSSSEAWIALLTILSLLVREQLLYVLTIDLFDVRRGDQHVQVALGFAELDLDMMFTNIREFDDGQ